MKAKIPRCPFPVGCWVSADKFEFERGKPFQVKTVTYHRRYRDNGWPNSEWLINGVWSGYWLRRVRPPATKARPK